MKRSFVAVALVSLLSVFMVAFSPAAPANAGGVYCKTYTSDPSWDKPPRTRGLVGNVSQTCTGSFAWHQAKAMVQRHVKRSGAPDTWQTVAQNVSKRMYQPNRRSAVGVRFECRAGKSKGLYRIVGTFTSMTSKGTPGGTSARSQNELFVQC